MKILYDYLIFSLQRYGGVSRYFCGLIKAIQDLCKEEIEIFLFQGLHINDYITNDMKVRLKSYWGYKRPYIKKTNFIFSTLNRFLFEAYKKKTFFNNYNTIYHPTYYSDNLLKPHKNDKIVITVYDMIYEKFPKYFSNIKFSSYNLILYKKKKAIEMADAIICISNNTKKDLLEYYKLDENKVYVTYLGKSLNKHIGNFCYKLSKPYILFVGNRGGYKNFDILLKAYYYGRFYKNFDLICFGGNFFNKNELENISRFNLRKKIKFFKGGDEVLAFLYRNAKCLVYASMYEGFGLPVIEAMNLGCPVIAANSSSLPEIVGDCALFFEADSIDDLITKLTSIMSDDKKRKIIIEKGLKRATKFSWKNTALKTIEIYKKLANED